MLVCTVDILFLIAANVVIVLSMPCIAKSSVSCPLVEGGRCASPSCGTNAPMSYAEGLTAQSLADIVFLRSFQFLDRLVVSTNSSHIDAPLCLCITGGAAAVQVSGNTGAMSLPRGMKMTGLQFFPWCMLWLYITVQVMWFVRDWERLNGKEQRY